MKSANCRLKTGREAMSVRGKEGSRGGAERGMKMRAEWGWRADWQTGHENTKNVPIASSPPKQKPLHRGRAIGG